MAIVLLALATFVAAATALPLLSHQAWWVRSLDFPRAQIFLFGVMVGATLLIRGIDGPFEVSAAAMLAVALAYQGWRILPYTRLWKKEVEGTSNPEAPQVSLLVANVLMSNRDFDRLLTIVRRTAPDIFLALEPDKAWEERLDALLDDLPHTMRKSLENRYGMLLYSRFELIEPITKHLVRDDIPSFHTGVHLASGETIWLHCMHPEPPSPTEADESTERDAELLMVAREVHERNRPTIVCGDFNDVGWSDTTRLFQKISGLLDPRRGRGMFNSFNARNPLLRWPLDHVFHSPSFALSEIRRLPDFGSDHFPVYVRLSLNRTTPLAQELPDADADDVEEATEKITEAGSP